MTQASRTFGSCTHVPAIRVSHPYLLNGELEMLVPDEATSLWDVEGWAGCGEAELVPVGRGREYIQGGENS